jgi:truncated hemoglobin YjbI
VGSAAAEEKTPYELLGGDDGVRKLTADFYELMDTFGRMAEMCRTKD